MNGNVFNYTAAGEIPPHRIVCFDEADDKRKLGTEDGTPAGITMEVGCSKAGDRIDVQEDGATLLQLGENVTAGVFLKSGEDGKAVKLSTDGGLQYVIAQAKEDGKANEIIRVNITKFVIQ